MDQVRGIMNAFVELIEKLVGDNEALKKIIDTIKQILGKFIEEKAEPETETEAE